MSLLNSLYHGINYTNEYLDSAVSVLELLGRKRPWMKSLSIFRDRRRFYFHPRGLTSPAHVNACRSGKKNLTLDYTPGCSFQKGAKQMQIGLVAKRIGLTVDAIRFYERNALLPRPPRTQGGFRQYAETDVETLAFIRRVQGLGFKLSEIRGLLNLRGSRLQPCAPVRRRLEEKLSDVRRKLADLQKLEHELRLALRSCNRELKKRPAHCPILTERNSQKPEMQK